MTRAYNTATTQQNSGGAVAGVTAGKNAIINGGMDIWQRGTSFVGGISSAAMGPDRWNTYRNGSGSTFSRQVTGDTTNLPFIQYCTRVQRDSGNTGTTPLYLFQDFESVNSIPFAGKPITLSFYARKGANYSEATSGLIANVYAGTGTDQSLRAGYTNGNYPISQTATLTTTWQRFTFTGTVTSTTTQLGIRFDFTPTGTAGAADYFEITGVQLEVGSVATPFSRAGGTIAGELAACQRYYFRLGAGGGGNTAGVQFGYYLDATASSSTNLWGILPLPVTMRKTPSSVDYSSVGWITTWGAGVNAISVIAVYDGSSVVGSNPQSVVFQMTTTGATTNTRYPVLSNNQTSGYLGVSAEL